METKKDYNSPNVKLFVLCEDDVIRTSPGATEFKADEGDNTNSWLGAWGK